MINLSERRKKFIEKGNKIHNYKYDYSKVNYINYQTKVCIICPEHGEFWQTPANHLTYKQGCPKCASNIRGFKKRIGITNFINRANKIHNYKYDYSKFIYENNGNKSIIICPIHGEFLQSAAAHLSGEGCPKCGNIEAHNKQRKPLEQFINECKIVHNNKYDYSLVTKDDYINKKICIICPIHGEFWQRPKKHLLHKHGCPKCSDSSLEKIIEEQLIKNNILYESQKTFSWLKYKLPLKLDFYLPNYNIAIECQGIQHFVPIKYTNKKEEDINHYNISILRDDIKYNLCKENGIKIFYYSTIDKKYKYPLYNDINKLINDIKLLKNE